MRYVSLPTAALVFALGGLHRAPLVLAQNTAQRSPSPSQQMPDWLEKRWSNAHNQWQRTPVDISSQTDTVDKAVRARRNAYWMQFPLQMALKSGTPLPGLRVELPEVGEIRGAESIWVVAIFEGAHVFALDPERTQLYTEMNMRVNETIKSPDDLPIAPGALIDVLILGGTARTVQGTVHEFRVEPEAFSAQPGHSYLLHLLYEPVYGLIRPYQRWEISSGKLVPDDEDEVHRMQQGKSALAGRSVSEATEYIRSETQRMR